MREVFLAVQKGVYRHKIVAAGGEEVVTAQAVIAIRAERDDYHEYEILRLELGQLLDDATLVATVRRKDTHTPYKRDEISVTKGAHTRVIR